MSEPFITISSGGTTDSSASDSFDDCTPFSTPPSKTHDVSRASFHVKDLEHFANSLQNAADRAFPNQGRAQPRYTDVSVLLLRWEDDEMGVDWELQDLKNVFVKYGFSAEEWLIPTRNPHLKLMTKAIEVVNKNDETESLVVIYYAGHAFINNARQATWCCKADTSYASLDWSAIQTLFEKANFDVLMLLDCCAAASAAPTVGCAVTETIAACGFENSAPQPGRHSFTNTLIEVLEDWVDGLPFSAAMLHNKVLSLLKHERPERATNGKRRKVECRRTPIHIMGTADPRLPSIEIGRRLLPSLVLTKPACEMAASEDKEGLILSKLEGYRQEDLNDSCGTDFKVPRVIISLALEEDQNLNSETCEKWLASCPALVRFATVEAVYKSFSTLLLLSVPVFIWNLLPETPACSFIGYATSTNLMARITTTKAETHALASFMDELKSGKGSETSRVKQDCTYYETTGLKCDGCEPCCAACKRLGLDCSKKAKETVEFKQSFFDRLERKLEKPNMPPDGRQPELHRVDLNLSPPVQAANRVIGSSAATTGSKATSSLKSPLYRGISSPYFAPAPLTGAAALEDEHQQREKSQQNHADVMVENPGYKALSSLMAAGKGAKSPLPTDHSHQDSIVTWKVPEVARTSQHNGPSDHLGHQYSLRAEQDWDRVIDACFSGSDLPIEIGTEPKDWIFDFDSTVPTPDSHDRRLQVSTPNRVKAIDTIDATFYGTIGSRDFAPWRVEGSIPPSAESRIPDTENPLPLASDHKRDESDLETQVRVERRPVGAEPMSTILENASNQASKPIQSFSKDTGRRERSPKEGLQSGPSGNWLHIEDSPNTTTQVDLLNNFNHLATVLRYTLDHGIGSFSGSFCGSSNPDRDWTKISDLAERRRIQNRIAQRNYRRKLKRRLEDLERRAGSPSASPLQLLESNSMIRDSSCDNSEDEEMDLDSTEADRIDNVLPFANRNSIASDVPAYFKSTDYLNATGDGIWEEHRWGRMQQNEASGSVGVEMSPSSIRSPRAITLERAVRKRRRAEDMGDHSTSVRKEASPEQEARSVDQEEVGKTARKRTETAGAM